MPRFRVNISPGVSHIVDAQTEEEARKKTAAEIAKGAVSPFYDELFFDYETGVDPRDPDLAEEAKSIRRRLGRAEKESEEDKILNDLLEKIQKTKSPIEQEDVMENAVGTAGYVRNTKGQLALTPSGLELLGLPVQQRRLQDGSIINLNTIIDEKDFNLKTGDLADLTGIAGPVIGTIAAFMPQTRLLKGLYSLLGGRKPLANTLAAGIGSAGGKAAEEYVDAQQGFQLQDRDELEDLLKEEFIVGSVGQGVFGEVPAKLYRMFLGKRAPIEDQRILEQLTKNRSWDDVQKLDESLGREASEREIKKAIKNGKVKLFDYEFSRGALPSQQTYQRMLAGKYQQFAEQTLGNNRDVANAAVLRAELDKILIGIKNEREALNSYISASSKEGLDEQVNKAFQKLRTEEAKVTNVLKELLKDIGADVIEAGNYGNIPSRYAFGQSLKDTLASARAAVTREMGKKYSAVDAKFVDLATPGVVIVNKRGRPQIVEGPKTQLEREKARIINKAINSVILKHVRVGLDIIEDYKGSGNFYNLKAPGQEISGSVAVQTYDILKNMAKRAEDALNDKGSGITLREIRNDLSKIREFSQETLQASHERRLLDDIMKTFDDTKYVNGKSLDNSDSILTELEHKGIQKVKANLAEMKLRLDPADERMIKRAVQDLKDANKLNFERMQPFDSLEMDRLISNAKKGSLNADKVYKEAILNGSTQELSNIFRALREYDIYKQKIGKAKQNEAGKFITSEDALKAQLKQRLFTDAFKYATKDELTDVNFVEFARQMKKFDREYQGKLDLLFTDSITGKKAGSDVMKAIDQINMISPNLKPQPIKILFNNFTKKMQVKVLMRIHKDKPLLKVYRI